MKRRCYYEILEVESKATPDDIKQAYRKQAIKWHPDKNQSPEAKERFQEIGEAYAVLSDPNERTWYDHHKEQILRPNASGLDENDEKYDELLTFGLDIWPYFERHCFKEFDDAEGGFFAVYRKVFEIIKGEEEKAKNNNIDPDDDDVYEGIGGKALPGFGDTKTSDEKVVEFYTAWENFSTFKNFSWKDLHNPNEGYNRQIKRLIEKDNKKERQKEKKKYLDTIKNLVHYVQKRDPRYQAYIKNQMIEKQRKAEEQRQKEEAKKKEQEALKKKHREEEAERYRLEYEQRKAQGLIEEEEEPAEQVHYEDWYCEICDKEFKTQNQLENHKQSKAHAKKYKELLQEMMLEEERKDFEENEESAPVDKEEEPVKKSKKKKKNKKKNQKAQEESDEEEETRKEKVEPPKKEQNNSKATQSKFASVIDQTSDKSSEKEEENSDDDIDFGQFVSMNKKNVQKSKKNTKKETVPEKEEEEEEVEVEQAKPTQVATEEVKLPENDGKQDVDQQSEDREPDDQDDDQEKADTKEPEKKLNKAKLRKLKKQEKAKQQQAFVCNVCKASFETRNKLYQHVKQLNHEFKMA